MIYRKDRQMSVTGKIPYIDALKASKKTFGNLRKNSLKNKGKNPFRSQQHRKNRPPHHTIKRLKPDKRTT